MTEFLNELPTYIALPLLLITVIGVSLLPAGILNYADRHFKERTVILIALIMCSMIGSAIMLGYLMFE